MKIQKVLCETQDNQRVEVDASILKQRISVYGLSASSEGILCVKTHSQRWELPGGTPEPGETISDALVRELLEEAGVNIEVGNLFFQRESFYLTPSKKAYHSIQLYFEVTCMDSPRATNEVEDVHFVPRDELSRDSVNWSSYLAINSYLNGNPPHNFITKE